MGEHDDAVNHPGHYTSHPSGVECIDVVEHMNFCRGGATKYIWRAGLKGGPEKEIEDLEKARWLLDREIRRLKRAVTPLFTYSELDSRFYTTVDGGWFARPGEEHVRFCPQCKEAVGDRATVDAGLAVLTLEEHRDRCTWRPVSEGA